MDGLRSSPAAVLVFVRAPVAGRVKTRLAAEIGDAAALRVYRRLAEHAVSAALAVAPPAAVRVHYTPTDAGPAVRAWLGDGPEYLPQAEGELGARLHQAFAEGFAAGFGRIVVVGSDLPELTAERIGRALAVLETEPAVLGPARDGGYWLLGLREMAAGAFDGMPWSTGRLLDATLARLRASGVEPALLETLADVDTADDLPAGWREWAVAG